MFRLYRTGCKVPKTLKTMFPSYDAARLAFRKWVRKNKAKLARDNALEFYNNPRLSDWGFSIQKVG